MPHVFYNAVILTSTGQHIGTPDAWLDDVGLAIEVDSIAHHTSPTDFARTLARNARYAAAGVPVLGVLPSDLIVRPAGVLHDVVAARTAAGERVRPPVVLSRHESPSSGRLGWRWGA